LRQFAELTDDLEWHGVSGFDPKILDEDF